ncbi:MAG: hemolysin III family protein, partial [Myxococcota bacterium]
WTALSILLSREILGSILLGGVFYAIGAVIYSIRWPDPWPKVFGYHEIFHALVLLASMLHFAAIAQIVSKFG